MSELLDLALSIVAQARGVEVEAFTTHERNFHVKAFSGEVESLSAAEPRGAGVRIVDGTKVGFAYTTDLTRDGIASVVAHAKDNAAYATEDEAVALAPAWGTPPDNVEGLAAEGHSEVTPEVKTSFAVELDKSVRSLDGRVRTVEESVYADSDTSVAIATSTGIEGEYRRTDAWCYTLAIVTADDDTQIGFEFDLGRTLAELDRDAVARHAVDRAVRVLGARKIPSTRLPVVLDPYTSGQFLGVLGSALTAEAVQKGRSLFAGRVGEKVAGAKLTLVDDGRVPRAPGSAPWDAEGVPTRRTEVIREGVLHSFLYDTKSARRESRESTGNASRSGFKSPPGPSPTNMAFDPTGEAAADILGREGRAFLVQDLHGVHSGANPISGDFSVGATGLLLENGEPGQPVKEVTVAAPMLEILEGIVAVGDDRRWLPFGGSFGGATTLVAEMTIAGE